MDSVPTLQPTITDDLGGPTPDYDVQLESLSQWQIAWMRFKRHRMALIGSVLFFSMVMDSREFSCASSKAICSMFKQYMPIQLVPSACSSCISPGK